MMLPGKAGEQTGGDTEFGFNARFSYGGHAYCIFPYFHFSWQEAKDFCESVGGHLLRLDTEGDIVSFMAQSGWDRCLNLWMDDRTENSAVWYGNEPQTAPQAKVLTEPYDLQDSGGFLCEWEMDWDQLLDGDPEEMLTGYYWYGGIQSPLVYDFHENGTFVVQGIMPGRSDLSYDSHMTVLESDFFPDGLKGLWALTGDADTLDLAYLSTDEFSEFVSGSGRTFGELFDQGPHEYYQYHTAGDGGPESDWPVYYYGEWDAVSITGTAYTEHQTLGRINKKQE